MRPPSIPRSRDRFSTPGKRLSGWSAKSQITNPQEFHPQCRPEEVFDPKSGSCIPITNLAGQDPVGTLECPDGFILDDNLGLCVPESPTDQAAHRTLPRRKKKKVFARDLLEQVRLDTGQKKLSGKLERCVMDVKSSLRKKNKGVSEDKIKSQAIAVCRSRLGG